MVEEDTDWHPQKMLFLTVWVLKASSVVDFLWWMFTLDMDIIVLYVFQEDMNIFLTQISNFSIILLQVPDQSAKPLSMAHKQE